MQICSNPQIKSHSFIPSGTITSIFKEATKICSEIEYLIDMFGKKGHDGETSQNIINNFEKETRSVNNTNNNSDKKQTITFL